MRPGGASGPVLSGVQVAARVSGSLAGDVRLQGGQDFLIDHVVAFFAAKQEADVHQQAVRAHLAIERDPRAVLAQRLEYPTALADQVAVVVFDLQVGDTVSVTAIGSQDPDLFVFGPDDALVIEDTMMGPGSNALANVISAPVAGQYLAAAVNATGAPGQISMTLQTFAEFELLDVPNGTVAPQDITTFDLEAFAGERIHVLVASSTFVPTIGIGQGGDILAFGSIVADNVQLVELDVPADGFFDVVVFGDDTGGSFVMYTTVQVGA